MPLPETRRGEKSSSDGSGHRNQGNMLSLAPAREERSCRAAAPKPVSPRLAPLPQACPVATRQTHGQPLLPQGCHLLPGPSVSSCVLSPALSALHTVLGRTRVIHSGSPAAGTLPGPWARFSSMFELLRSGEPAALVRGHATCPAESLFHSEPSTRPANWIAHGRPQRLHTPPSEPAPRASLVASRCQPAAGRSERQPHQPQT